MSTPRDLFDLPEHLHYLNCAFMAPMSRRVAEAGHAAIERLRVPSRLRPDDFFDQSLDVRRRFAALIGTHTPERVAIVPAVSYAMATLARNTPLAPGQNVVVLEEQFPSNVYTWKRACATTGATLRTVAAPPHLTGRAAGWNDAVLETIDENTAVVTIPHLHWTDGTRFDLARIGRRARQHGARLIVDGTQSVGAIPFDATALAVDAVVCAGYKWLMGPYSVGLAHYGPAYDDGIPLEENWITRLHSEDFSGLVQYQDAYQPGAIRYDVGERSNFVLLPMLAAGLAQVRELDPARIQTHCRNVTTPVMADLQQLGCWVEEADGRASHLFGVRVPTGVDMEVVRTTLTAHDISVSVRGTAIRVSPHVYNTAADLEALRRALAEAIAQRRE